MKELIEQLRTSSARINLCHAAADALERRTAELAAADFEIERLKELMLEMGSHDQGWCDEAEIELERLRTALRIKTEEHDCCSGDLIQWRKSAETGIQENVELRSELAEVKAERDAWEVSCNEQIELLNKTAGERDALAADAARLDFLQANHDGVTTITHVVSQYRTDGLAEPKDHKLEFLGWSIISRHDEHKTVRAAIDAAIQGEPK